MPGVSGIILAAGSSRRLGRPKQLLDLDERPILDIVLGHAAASNLDSVILVLGSEAARIAAAVSDHGQRVVVNPDFAEGQSTSLKAGIRALAVHVDAALVLLGDQPQVVPDVIDGILRTYATSDAPIVMPSYSGIPGNPVLFRRSLFPDLLAITGDRGARDVIRARQDAVVRVPFPGLSPPRDVDTDDDYASLQAAWANRLPSRG